MLIGLSNDYCLYKKVGEEQANGQVTGSQGKTGISDPSNPAQSGANGQCCPQPNPITIQITNSQDTNSRNTTTEEKHIRQVRQQPKNVPVQNVPVQKKQPVTPKPAIVMTPVFVPRVRIVKVPVVQQVVQKVPVVQTVIKEVPVERIKETPAEEDNEIFYPAWQ